VSDLYPIPGYPNYSITRDGRVWSKARPRARGGWLRPQLGGNKHLQLFLRVDGVTRTVRVHTLVALTFLGPRPEGQIVRHLNDDPLDNRPENLAYGTHLDNMRDMARNGGHHNTRKTHCKQGHPYVPENIYLRPNGNRRCKACCLRRPA